MRALREAAAHTATGHRLLAFSVRRYRPPTRWPNPVRFLSSFSAESAACVASRAWSGWGSRGA